MKRKANFPALLLILLAAFCDVPAHARWVQPPPCKNAFTPQTEITEGKKAATEVMRKMPVLPDSNPVSQYVRQLGMKLVQYAPGNMWPYEFHVVNEADINAFALPGGPIFVNLGTIQAAETEAQLAGVMAHEISHVVMRHATCNITKQQGQAPLWALGQLAAGIFIPGAGGTLAAQGVGAAAGMTFLKMGRDAEKQADLLGTDILYEAGYDPRGMVQFFEVIQGKYGSGGAQFLSDHPNPGNRTEYVNAEIATLPPREKPVRTTAQFQKIKQIAAGMHAYTAKEIQTGAWKNDPGQRTSTPIPGQSGEPVVASGRDVQPAPTPAQPGSFQPSGQWALLNGAYYSLQYPDNWQASESSKGGTTITPSGGVSAGKNGETAVHYGVLIDSFRPEQSAGLAAATSQLIRSMQQGNPGMQAVTAVDDIQVGDRAARSVEFVNQGAAPGGDDERDWLVTLAAGNGSVRYLVFVAPDRDFKALRKTYQQMLDSFSLR
jgi:beta-barrel assembly-enhancing protease